MARPNRPDDQSAKTQAPVKTPETEQEEEEASEKRDQEQEHQRDQNRYGNAALSAMMGASVAGASGAPDPGKAMRQQSEIVGDVSYGGEDDADETPLTLEELVRSWNPRTKREKDRDTPTDVVLRVDLPAEDTAFLAAIRAGKPESTPARFDDRLYQPTATSVASGLTPWAGEVQRWTQPTLVHRTLLQLVTPAAGFLQDPHGRAVFSRARQGAIATCVLLDGQRWDASSAAFTQFCLELAGSGMTVQGVWDAAVASGQQLPMARDLCASALSASSHRVRKRPLPPVAQERLMGTLTRLAGLSQTADFVPDLHVSEPTPDPDDPLGLDEVLVAFTEAAAPPDQAAYDTAVRTAERLAVSCAHTRIRYAGVSAAIAQATGNWSSGSPTLDLLDLSEALDHDIQRCLRLLVEVARAAKGRSVDLQGLRNGLKRASKMLGKTRHTATQNLTPLIGGILHPDPTVAPEPMPSNDALQAAWDDRSQTAALEALRALPEGLDREVAIALTEATLSNHPRATFDALEPLADKLRGDQPLIAAALDVCAGGCALWAEASDLARRCGGRLQDLGRDRQSGMLLTAGALTDMSALELRGEHEAVEDLRRATGTTLHYWSAKAGVTLLARWAPPEED